MHRKIGSIESLMASLKTLFGAPPVLTTEDSGAFDQIWGKLIEQLQPADMLEDIYIYQAVTATWEIKRYIRTKALMIQYKYRQREEKTAPSRALRKRQRATMEGKSTAEANRLVAAELAARVDRIPDERDHAQALEYGIEYYQKLDFLLQRAIVRLNSALEQLEQYRLGLGLRARRLTDDIIEGEFTVNRDEVRQVTAAPDMPGEPSGEPMHPGAPSTAGAEARGEAQETAMPPDALPQAVAMPNAPTEAAEEAQVAAPPLAPTEAQGEQDAASPDAPSGEQTP
jgi:hypothetical protein